jgi:hypothetical protein
MKEALELCTAPVTKYGQLSFCATSAIAVYLMYMLTSYVILYSLYFDSCKINKFPFNWTMAIKKTGIHVSTNKVHGRVYSG